MTKRNFIFMWFIVFNVILGDLPCIWAGDLALASEVVVFQSPDASSSDFLVYMQMTPKLKSYVEFWKSNHPSDVDIENLRQLQVNAQRDYLKSPAEEAKKSFERITDLALTQDWKSSERAIIFYAYLRLAQLQSEKVASDHFLSEAIGFDAEQKVDQALFPPPLVAHFNELKKNILSQSFPWSSPKSQSYDTFLLNGRRLKNEGPNLIPPGKHRWTWVSNSYVTETQLASRQELKDFGRSNKTFIDGNCEAARFRDIPPLGKNRGAAFFGAQCVKDEFGNLLNKNTVASSYSPGSSPPAYSSPPFLKEEEHKSILKSPWLWIGVGAATIITVALIKNGQKSGDGSVTPNHQQGL